MRTVYVQELMRLPLGKQGENGAARIVWQGLAARYQALYGSGAFTLTAKRCGDAVAYPVAVSTEGGDVVWLVRAADVANPGSGSCELTYTVDGAVAKSQTWSTYVAASISGDAPGEPPEEPAKAWFAAIQAQIGNLDDLTTKARASLVAAINEAVKTGSGGAGSISMRTADGYIQYSTDGGETWENLIAVADLKGDPGPQGPKGDVGEHVVRSINGVFPEEDGGLTLSPGVLNAVNRAGDTMAGALSMGGFGITNLAFPRESGDGATKGYVDSRRLVLRASVPVSWTGSGPYVQQVAVPGLLETDTPHVAPVYADDGLTAIAQKDAWDCISQAQALNGALKLVCLEERPQREISILLEVNR